MKNNKLLIVLILLLQGVCCAGFAQSGLGTNQCNGGDCKPFLDQTYRHTDSLPSSESTTQSTQPVDPNEIIGLDGYDVAGSTDTLRWVSATQTLAYTVYFENDADFATAAASKTMVTHSNIFNFNEAILPNIGLHILSHC